MPKISSKKIPLRKIILLVLAGFILAGLAWMYFKPKNEQPQYISAEVTRGDIEDSVLATGVLDEALMVAPVLPDEVRTKGSVRLAQSL